MEQILKYFPGITAEQQRQFSMLQALYNEWNQKINVISRKDIGNLYERHVLHSLGIAKIISFSPDTNIMDLGCGGGFPGIPLAIMFPQARFHLVDSIGKKIHVAQEVAQAIGLNNISFSHARGEEIHNKYHFVVSRAVMPLTGMMKCIRKNIDTVQTNTLPNGILALKGGELSGEIAPMRSLCTTWDLSDFFTEEFFETKKVVHVAVKN